MTWLKKNFVSLLVLLMALVGVGLLVYPTFSDWWNSFHQSRAVAGYAQAVAELDPDRYKEVFEAAEKYNEKLCKSGVLWNMSEEEKKEYNALLDVNGSGIMGYIDIPKINVTLPVYHGTDEAVLQIAIGHLAGTSLPVGGTGTHCSVSGHRGLPSARLFTDLDKLAPGDNWTVTVLDRTVTYEVDQIRIVLPSEVSELKIDPEKDYFTLVTCTPYGINSHRLLVRGHRVENAQGKIIVLAEGVLIEPVYLALVIGVPILVLLFIWSMADAGRRVDYLRLSRSAADALNRRIEIRRQTDDSRARKKPGDKGDSQS